MPERIKNIGRRPRMLFSAAMLTALRGHAYGMLERRGFQRRYAGCGSLLADKLVYAVDNGERGCRKSHDKSRGGRGNGHRSALYLYRLDEPMRRMAQRGEAQRLLRRDGKREPRGEYAFRLFGTRKGEILPQQDRAHDGFGRVGGRVPVRIGRGAESYLPRCHDTMLRPRRRYNG